MRPTSLNSRPRASSSLQAGSCRHARVLPVLARAVPAAPPPEEREELKGRRSSSPAIASPTSSRRGLFLLLSSSSLLLLLLEAAPPPPPFALAAPLVDKEEAEAAISSARASVVSVLAARRGPSVPLSPLCSAVAVLPGVVATAAHALAAAAGSPLLVRIQRSDSNDLVFPASLIGTDPGSDVALLRVDFSSLSPSSPSPPLSSSARPPSPSSLLPPLAFGPSSSLRVGQSLFIVAAPVGDGAPLATAGVVSGLKRAIALPQGSAAAATVPGPLVTGALQTDAPFAGAGWAGGAAVDSSGALVGIATNVRGGGGGGGARGSGGGGFGGRGAGTTATGVGFALASDNVAAAIGRIMR